MNTTDSLGAVLDSIIASTTKEVRESLNPGGLTAAKTFLRKLIEKGIAPADTEIKYDFDMHYSIKFFHETMRVATFWSPWIGGFSWRIDNA